jgi:hypothetical protein
VRRILKKELKYFPYKVQIGQSLSTPSELKRVQFREKYWKNSKLIRITPTKYGLQAKAISI